MASGVYPTLDRSLIRPMACRERQTANKTSCEFQIIKYLSSLWTVGGSQSIQREERHTCKLNTEGPRQLVDSNKGPSCDEATVLSHCNAL